MKEHAVFVLCNTIVERIAQVDDHFLEKFNLLKGDGKYVYDAQTVMAIEAGLMDVKIASGGSGANVAHGVANLGLSSAFAGTIGNDRNGEFFKASMEKLGIHTIFDEKESGNGVVFIFITPDKQRSFMVVPGVSYMFDKQKLPEKKISSSQFFHTTAYFLEFEEETLQHAARVAHKHGTEVSFDMSSPATIRQNGEKIENFLPHVDVLFISREEAEALGFSDASVIDFMHEHYDIGTVAYKMGRDGAIISHHGHRHFVPAYAVEAVSETGAGDAFASGVLYGLAKGFSTQVAGMIGSYYASRCVMQPASRVHQPIPDIESNVSFS